MDGDFENVFEGDVGICDDAWLIVDFEDGEWLKIVGTEFEEFWVDVFD